MRLCRYDDDRLGVVRGEMVHDVTEAQSQIRAAAPYAMKGDAVIAALPAWRSRLGEMAAKAPGKPVAQVRLLSPVARPSKLVAAPTNYKAHIEEMAARATAQNIKPSPAIGTAGLFLKANSSLVGPSEGVAIRFPERRNEHEVELAIIFGKQGSDIPREKALDYVIGYSIGLDMTARGPRAMAGHRRRNSRSGQRAAHDFRQRRAQAEQQYQAVDLRLPQADRMGLDLLHLLSWRRALYRNARGREPGQAGRHHARAHRSDRRDVGIGARSPGGRVGDARIAVDRFLRRSVVARRIRSTRGPSRSQRGGFRCCRSSELGMQR